MEHFERSGRIGQVQATLFAQGGFELLEVQSWRRGRRDEIDESNGLIISAWIILVVTELGFDIASGVRTDTQDVV